MSFRSIVPTVALASAASGGCFLGLFSCGGYEWHQQLIHSLIAILAITAVVVPPQSLAAAGRRVAFLSSVVAVFLGCWFLLQGMYSFSNAEPTAKANFHLLDLVVGVLLVLVFTGVVLLILKKRALGVLRQPTRTAGANRVTDPLPQEVQPMVEELNLLLSHSDRQAEEARTHARCEVVERCVSWDLHGPILAPERGSEHALTRVRIRL